MSLETFTACVVEFSVFSGKTLRVNKCVTFSAATAESHHIFNFYRIGHKVGRIIGLHKTKISFQVSTSESFV